MTEKLSNPRVSCVNSDLTQNPPTFSIAPIHADEVTMNANARNPRRRFDSYPLRHFQVRSAECVVRNGGRLHSALRTRWLRISLRKEVVAVSRERILRLTSLSSCAG